MDTFKKCRTCLMASYAFLKASFKQTHWDNSSVHVRRFYGQAKKTNACILGMLVLTAVSPLSRAGALMSGDLGKTAELAGSLCHNSGEKTPFNQLTVPFPPLLHKQ